MHLPTGKAPFMFNLFIKFVFFVDLIKCCETLKRRIHKSICDKKILHLVHSSGYIQYFHFVVLSFLMLFYGRDFHYTAYDI